MAVKMEMLLIYMTQIESPLPDTTTTLHILRQTIKYTTVDCAVILINVG